MWFRDWIDLRFNSLVEVSVISLLLLFLAQSANPYGSPVDQILRPSEVRSGAQTGPQSRQNVDTSSRPLDPVEVRFNQCVNQAVDNPENGVLVANKWQIEGGGYLARHCLGFAYAEQQDWVKATTEFAKAAEAAENASDKRAANFWAQAGNAALAKGHYADAHGYLESALRQDTLGALQEGEIHLDLARVFVALDQYEEARKEFDKAHQLAPQDPLGWLLSATLARRMNDLGLAKTDIAKAANLAGGDPAVALEAGNIAYAAGDTINAQTFWKQAVEFDVASAPGKAAQKYLAQLESGPPIPAAR